MGRTKLHGDHHDNSLQSRSERKQNSSGEGINKYYECKYCSKDISEVGRMKCNICLDSNLCVECFSVGAVVWPHKSNHPYRVTKNVSFPLISPDWSADQEVLLLEGLDNYGRNWAKVAEHVATKSELECAEHYNTCYLSTPNFIPEMKEADKIIATGKGKGEATVS